MLRFISERMIAPSPYGHLEIVPYGDAALMVRPSAGTQPEREAIILAVRQTLFAHASPLVRETVSGFDSLLVTYDTDQLSPTAAAILLSAQVQLPVGASVESAVETYRIPVVFGGEDGPDLTDVAHDLRMPPDELIRSLTENTLRIAFVGIVTSAYLSGLHLPAKVPRLASPRTRVAAGSVLVAGENALIAPYAGPSGWRVVGRTAITLSDIRNDPPIRYKAGDAVELIAVEAHEFGPLRAVGSSW